MRPSVSLPVAGAWPLAAAILAATLLAAPLAAQTERPARVRVDTVREVPLDQTVPILGRVVAREQGPVAAAIDGPVRAVHVQVGDGVEAGQLLVELAPEMREAMLARSESDRGMFRARLQSASAELQISRDELARLQRLEGSSAFPRARFEEQQLQVLRAGAAVAEAEAALARTEAELQAARIEIARTRIVAPYAGVVTRRYVSAGAYVSPGTPLLALVNDRDLEVEAEVPGDRVGGLRAGTAVRAAFDDGMPLGLRVRAVIPDENPLTRTQQVRFTLADGAHGAAVVNQSVTIQVPLGVARQVLSVHKDAVVNSRGQSVVYVVEADTASLRPVRLGEAVGARLEILDGLAPGERVVVRGNERLRPGQSVSVVDG